MLLQWPHVSLLQFCGLEKVDEDADRVVPQSRRLRWDLCAKSFNFAFESGLGRLSVWRLDESKKLAVLPD
jgi:hypothetical protein